MPDLQPASTGLEFDPSFLDPLKQMQGEQVSLMCHTSAGTVLLAQLHEETLGPRPFPVGVTAALAQTQFGPVVAIQFLIYDRPGDPLRLRDFGSPGDTEHFALFYQLAKQATITILFFKQFTLAAAVNVTLDRAQLAVMLQSAILAEDLYEHTPLDQRDFAKARQILQSDPQMNAMGFAED